MSFGSFLGVLGMLGLVLGLLLLTLRLLKKISPTIGGAGGRLPMEVVQRLPLGPRQGIAVVRVGGSVMAVSVGDGGVRHLADLTEADLATVPVATTSTPTVAFTTQLAKAFTRNAGLAVLLMVGTTVASAQGATAPTKTAPAAPATAAGKPADAAAKPAAANAKPAATAAKPAQTALVRSGASRADTMVSRLAPQIDVRVGEQKGGLRLTGTVGVVVMMGLLTLIPTVVLMMTGFTRILIVLHFLRQAIGAQSAPPAQLMAGLALLITGFVMAPTLMEVNRTALEPWMDGKIEQTEMLAEGVKPFRTFMLRQVRERDLSVYMNLSRLQPVARPEDVPLVVLMSAFVTSELRISFQIGFALFLPFIVIDVVVASVLMSMGMMMLPPAMISLPFKLLLFVLVDGWTLVVQSLVQSFH